MTDEQAMRVYRLAIDAKVNGDTYWWRGVLAEVREVCAAPTIQAAAAVIAWWHHDWSSLGDSASAAARRIRLAAKAI